MKNFYFLILNFLFIYNLSSQSNLFFFGDLLGIDLECLHELFYQPMKERSVAYFILIRFYTLLMTFLLVSSFKLFSEEGIAFKDNYEVYKELEGTDKTSIKKGMRLALRDLTIDISSITTTSIFLANF